MFPNSSHCVGQKMMRPKFKEIKTWSEEKMVSHKVLYDNSDPHMNFSMEVHQPLNDVDIHLEVRITNKLDPYYSSTLNTTLNICRILGFANQSPVGRFVHGFIREYGNIIDTCPIPKVSPSLMLWLSYNLQWRLLGKIQISSHTL